MTCVAHLDLWPAPHSLSACVCSLILIESSHTDREERTMTESTTITSAHMAQMMAAIVAIGSPAEIRRATLYARHNVAQGAALALVYRKVMVAA